MGDTFSFRWSNISDAVLYEALCKNAAHMEVAHTFKIRLRRPCVRQGSNYMCKWLSDQWYTTFFQDVCGTSPKLARMFVSMICALHRSRWISCLYSHLHCLSKQAKQRGAHKRNNGFLMGNSSHTCAHPMAFVLHTITLSFIF